ncbi:MAG: phosphomannomutase/phosphoglucomutase [Planctomycetes bacterium]|nr:phosphomannomutase/phosphoglucomutase [Planctomycetota bacterium]
MPTGFSESRRCPGEKYAISEAVCGARTARHFPKCKECKWRDQPGAPQALEDPPVDLGAIFMAYDVRGTAGTQIHDTLAWKVGYATARHLLTRVGGEGRAHPERQWIAVGHDMRKSGERLARALAEGIRAAGAGAARLGEVETPAVYYAVGSLKALGGVQVTASHLPAQYNGFKITGPGCVPVGLGSGLEKIQEIVAGLEDTGLPPLGPLRQEDISTGYVEHVRKFAGTIGPMKVVMDCSNGMASKWTPTLLRDLGIDLEVLHMERTGEFDHEPNPLKAEALADVRQRVRAAEAALGACFDADADRIAIIDETGQAIPNDLLTALLAPLFLAKEPGATVVYDLRSSWALKEEIEKHGGVPRRERVGHSFMKAALRETRAPFGGELSGHSYYRDNFFCDSAVITLMEVLTLASARPGEPLSTLVAPLRRYFTTGEVNFEVEDKKKMVKRLAQTFSDGKVDFLDGVTVEYDDWWFNVRPSNTEPLLRLTLEAKTAALKDEMFEKLVDILGEPSEH